jgi:hypothetical protein
MSSEEYEHIQNMLEAAEDIVLGSIAKERMKNTKESDFIDIEDLL